MAAIKQALGGELEDATRVVAWTGLRWSRTQRPSPLRGGQRQPRRESAQVAAGPGLFEDGETSVAGVLETIGGGGANSACAAAALGGEVRFVGKVGTDALGGPAAAGARSAGVQTHLARDAALLTGTPWRSGSSRASVIFWTACPTMKPCLGGIDSRALEGAATSCGRTCGSPERCSAGAIGGCSPKPAGAASRLLDINFDPLWSTGSPARLPPAKSNSVEVLEWWTSRTVTPRVVRVHG